MDKEMSTDFDKSMLYEAFDCVFYHKVDKFEEIMDI